MTGMKQAEIKRMLCGQYCKNAGNRGNNCTYCGDLLKKFEQSETATVMVGEELMEEAVVLYDEYLVRAREAFLGSTTETR